IIREIVEKGIQGNSSLPKERRPRGWLLCLLDLECVRHFVFILKEAGKSSFRSFMVVVQRFESSVAIIQQWMVHASCKEMATTISSAEVAVYKGLQQCIEIVMSEISLPDL
ncbi:Exocyst complex component 5, partial [Stylosanthes scabra]|nr:Exocyst complex component 5 [Stylosanthes scabra]